MTPEIEKKLLLSALLASVKAGDAILDVYNSDFTVQEKEDNSPLTLADKKSNDVIISLLKNTAGIPSFPFLSEEGRTIPYDERKYWEYFWLIDPLDGTREFIKRNGEFTVNIALINKGIPVMGVVYVPVKKIFYLSSVATGAYRLIINDGDSGNTAGIISSGNIDDILGRGEKLPLKKNSGSGYTIVASRSHMNRETENFINNIKSNRENATLISAGSSIKLCLVADGSADVYPRLGPTMEWDTAAAHAVVNGAGKKVFEYDKNAELTYNKADLKNPWFVVR
ncbi:MAG: 3'(2'),5'-bisphosphate nucleotidase CysQ [Spirochaetes bacterium]|nr:3'(2'),5'-bisphosphate nucleotidase CysQ [Spirochaetota bacterium]